MKNNIKHCDKKKNKKTKTKQKTKTSFHILFLTSMADIQAQI